MQLFVNTRDRIRHRRRVSYLISHGVLIAALALLSVTTGIRAADFDHSRWGRILEATVSEDGWVDYDQIRSRLSSELKSYLRSLGKASLSNLDKKSRMAFWINAYNAICIQTLLDRKLPKTVPHAVLFGANIFKERTYRVAGKIRSLDDIEHGILRKEFKDNRIHAAIVCGASSCPRLRREAYTAGKLDAQLDGECRRWIQKGLDKKGKRKNRLDRKSNTFYASKIFDWFQEDFGDSDAGVLKFIQRFASADDRAYLEKNKIRVRYLSYDWSLNSREKK